MVRSFIIFVFLFNTFIINASEAQQKKTVCLNMIVKNEKDVIKRSLGSVKGIIDYWVILDTGSTDGTQEIIKEFMKDIPGELHEDPFRNFEYSRNKALDYAKGKADYTMFIDADEEWVYDDDFKLPHLDKDFYYVTIKHGNTVYVRNSFIKDKLNWRWHGVLHEYIGAPEARTSETIKGITNIYRAEGARSKDPKKYEKDAAVFEAALLEDPNNSRYRFYLAQSYRDAGLKEQALKNYQMRAAMGGWDQEVFWAMLEAAHLQRRLEMPEEVFIASYWKAYQYRPSRAEPLYYIANHYRSKGDNLTCYMFANLGVNIPFSDDILFVQKWIYDWGLPMEYSVGAYWIGKYDECRKASLKMLALPDLSESVQKTVEANLGFADKKLHEIKMKAKEEEEANNQPAEQKNALSMNTILILGLQRGLTYRMG